MKTDNIEQLIKENEWLIYKISSRYKENYSIDDLYQAGCIGIIKASKNYNDNNIKFSTYAYKYILGEMIDYIRKDRNIIISNEMYSLYKRYLKVKDLLSNKYNREVSFHEICSFMEIDEMQMLCIIESISKSKNIEENDYALHDKEEINLDDIINLNDRINELNENEKLLINYRYYLGYTQMETATLMGITQDKVSRNEKQILSKIKKNFT